MQYTKKNEKPKQTILRVDVKENGNMLYPVDVVDISKNIKINDRRSKTIKITQKKNTSRFSQKIRNDKRIMFYYKKASDYYKLEKKYDNLKNKCIYLEEKVENHIEAYHHLKEATEELEGRYLDLQSSNISLERENFEMREKLESLTKLLRESETDKIDLAIDLSGRRNYEVGLWEKINILSNENVELKKKIEICTTALTN